MGTKMDKLPYTPAELEGELARLKPLLGRLKTNEQIKAACHERELIEFDCATETLKNDAFWAYLRKISPPNAKPELHKVWEEITLHDRIGATSQELVDGQVLNSDTFVEFGRVIDSWKRLDGDRGLSLLIGCGELSAAKAQLEAGRISGAELFRLFLKLEKVKYNITEWVAPAMYDLRCRLHKCFMHMESTRVQQQGHAALPASSSTNAPRKSSTDQPLHQTTPSDNNSALIQDTSNINNLAQESAVLTSLASLAEDHGGSATKQGAQTLVFSKAHLAESSTSNFGIPPTASAEDLSLKLNEDRYFTAMRKIQRKLKKKEADVGVGKQTILATIGKIEEAKKHHDSILQNVSTQSDNIYILCCKIKDEWSCSSIEAAAAACQNFGETGNAILEAFEPIILHKKALRLVHEASIECEKLKNDYDNMKEVAELAMEDMDI